MEIDIMFQKKLKLKKKLLVIRDLILILTATFFLIIGFSYGIYFDPSIANSMINIRYGLFSFALIISATAIIIALYHSRQNEIINLFYPKIKGVKHKKIKEAVRKEQKKKFKI